MKFSPAGSGVVVSGRIREGAVEVAVTDEGVGMTEEQIEGILRDGGSTAGTRGEPGSGLGLRLCRDLVERQGGMVQVESVPAQGTTVRFTVPHAGAIEWSPGEETRDGSREEPSSMDREGQNRQRTA